MRLVIRSLSLLTLSAPLASLAACGDDAGSGASLAGSYQITAYTETQGSCDSTPQAIADSTHMVIQSGDFFGVKTLEAFVCPALDGCGVGDDAFAEFSFFTRQGDTWITDASASSYGGGSCSLSLTRQTLVPTADGVKIEATQSFGSVTLSEAQCEPDAATAHAAELDCAKKTLLTATKL